MNLIPDGSPDPQGGNLISPESGVAVEFNAEFSRVAQDLPSNYEDFIKYAKYVDKLYYELFRPSSTDRIGLAITLCLPQESQEQSQQLSNQWGDSGFYANMAKEIGMPCSTRMGEFNFKSGSNNLRVKVSSGHINLDKSPDTDLPARPTSKKRVLIDRLNQGKSRIRESQLHHGIFIDIDLTQDSPPPDVFDEMFELFQRYEQQIPQLIFP
jgi:hypothetical protein